MVPIKKNLTKKKRCMCKIPGSQKMSPNRVSASSSPSYYFSVLFIPPGSQRFLDGKDLQGHLLTIIYLLQSLSSPLKWLHKALPAPSLLAGSTDAWASVFIELNGVGSGITPLGCCSHDLLYSPSYDVDLQFTLIPSDQKFNARTSLGAQCLKTPCFHCGRCRFDPRLGN